MVKGAKKSKIYLRIFKFITVFPHTNSKVRIDKT
jgi:hypothetical protein